jgi:protein-S-isoprenylcysteine O-methyltransferase Ste14
MDSTRSSQWAGYGFRFVSILAGAATMFFAFFGARLLWNESLTPRAEAHVATTTMAAVIVVLVAVLAWITWTSHRAARRRLAPFDQAAATSEAATSGISWRQVLGIPLNVFLFLFLMVLSWGDARSFFAHPVRVGVVIVHLAMLPVMTFATSGRSKGVKHAPDWKPFFPLLVFHSLFTAVVMPAMDRRDLWTLPGGDVTRWVGLVLLAAGAFLRVGPMWELGRRFASVVAIREGHTLQTTGFYAAVRHPSYIGILLMDLGFAGVFRSTIALLLMPLVFWMFKRRMDVEEGFMVEAFGPQYRDYMSRTQRLVPGLY